MINFLHYFKINKMTTILRKSVAQHLHFQHFYIIENKNKTGEK